MPFAIPVVWREPSNHINDCYFCLTPSLASGMNRKKKQRIDYPNIPSAIRPVSHGEDLCEWDSKDKAHHCVKWIWPVRKTLEPGHKYGKHHSLVESSRNLLPTLHIKLGLTKNFVKAMDHNCIAFLHQQLKFLLLSDAKIQEDVFTYPDLCSLLHDEVFECIITSDEQRVWHAFQEMVTGFLGNRRADNYKDLVEELLSSYQKLGCICP